MQGSFNLLGLSLFVALVTFKVVAPRGIEPTICRLKVYRPLPLDDGAIKWRFSEDLNPKLNVRIVA